MKNLLMKILSYPMPIRSLLIREVVRKFSLLSYEDRIAIGALDRPHYGHCIFQAARLAALLKYPKISVIELGCGGGNGLLNAEMHIANVMKIFPVAIELYGFDMGSGLPSPQDYRDMPYYFKAGLYEMDQQSLRQELKQAKIIIGDVGETCATFFSDHDPAPIGCVFHDLDFYSSTASSLKILDAPASRILPRVFMYFDDIIGNNDVWLCNEFTGERLAINEFNREHGSRKICKNVYLPHRFPNQVWADQIYILHDFEHPKYNEFVGAREQIVHQTAIKLQTSPKRL